MTEEEAKTKWCPFARAASVTTGVIRSTVFNREAKSLNCLASGCMAWRWHTLDSYTERSRTSTTEGYCGLAGGYAP